MALYDNAYIITFDDNTQILIQKEVEVISPYFTTHTIKDEETLFSISQKYYKNTVDWYTIAEANNLDDPIVLTVGDNITIPNFNG